MKLGTCVLMLGVILLAGFANASGWSDVKQQAGAWGHILEQASESQNVQESEPSQDNTLRPAQCPPDRTERVCGYEDVVTRRCAWVSAACATTTFVCNAWRYTPAGRRVCAAGQSVCVPGTVWACNPVTERKWVCRTRCKD